uniref:Uncharacterized protein n=1 Tax=Caenorhabditis japonica TaxID=281687 RepID=A0A8R1HTM7_CAEJA
MLWTSALAIFLIAWSAVFLIDYVLRVAHFEPYLRLSALFGIEVSPFQLKFYVTPHHDVLADKQTLIKSDGLQNSRRPSCRRLLTRIWFSLGVIASVICLVGMTVYMSHLLMRDVGQWMSTRPKVAALRGGMEYRSMHHVLSLGPPSPTTVEGVKSSTISQEMHDAVIVEDEEYDMIEDGQKSARGLVPIIPGFNLPWSHIPIFMFVLVIAAVFHE